MKETMLILVDTKNNNNKFYHVTLADDDMTVTKRWGRVGSAGSSSTERTGEHGYQRAIKAKEKKGYKPTAVESNVKVETNQELSKVAQTYLAKDQNDPVISDLITRLVKYNQHQIMEKSGGQITVTDNGTLTTALGVVDIDSIKKARAKWNHIHKKGTHSTKKISLLEEYLTLIPQKVGYRRGWEEEWFTKEKYTDQLDFLDQLESSVQFASNSAVVDDEETDISEHANLFRMRLSTLDTESAEFKRINDLFEKTKNSIHSSRGMKLVRVYCIEDTQGEEAYNKAKAAFGNVRELWHGTRVSNVLSILKQGFYVPPVNSGFVTGRMFGDGVYASDQSTKSLNYATGFWGGSRMNQNCFMLLNDIVMGHEFRPRYWNHDSLNHAYTGVGKSGKPYQSIYVKGGTCSVMNNEMIVWNTDQIKIKYLCEFAQ